MASPAPGSSGGLDPLQIAVLAGAAAVGFALTLPGLVSSLHALQQDDYSAARFARWLGASKSRAIHWRLALIYVAATILHLSLAAGGNGSGSYLAPVVASGAAIVSAVRSPLRAPRKRALVYTGRARRLLAVSAALTAILFVAGFLAISQLAEEAGVTAAYAPGLAVLVMALVSVHAAPFITIAANLCLTPVQGSINLTYRVRARRKLERLKPMVVGITGSYGKTSTKYFTEAFLEPRFRVLKTRASFNTILGVCRAVNEELGPEHQVLIVEMGAYKRGEIREMADLTRPHIGVLTAIGPQHLERFGSIETIEKAKFELLESLTADGIAVINNDDARVRRLADSLRVPQVRRYGIEASAGDLDLVAESISHGPEGLTFILAERDGARVAVKTRLIGIHNVLNILAAASVARAAGVSLREIAVAIGRLQPVPHRLEVHTGADGVTIVDDAYNSNPVGAFNALDALGAFESGRKVLVTPGMVELGVEQDAWNEKLGARAADVCDFVILVGARQTAPIRRGLEGQGFAAERLVSARNLNAALETLKGIVHSGDVVLFENDLPDLYEE
ncbi:MAG TPA: UDP-N-acetylmuramoyl-tripeptide--D-alanyl-D-alanine ligase [Candidatus Limnocylindrales bacterium]